MRDRPGASTVGSVAGEHGRSDGTMVSVGERPVSASGADSRAHAPAELDASSPRTAAGTDRRYLLGLAAVILVATVARFWGLLYGLPHSYYPDESSVVSDALKMATTGDPRPSQFLWPTFWIYVVAISLRVGLLASWLPSELSPLGTAALDNMTYVYGVGRTVTALAGVLTVVGLYAVGVRWLEQLGLPTPRLYALLGAGFLALSP